MAPVTSEHRCIECPALGTNKDCLADVGVKLSSYRPGEKGTIFQVCGEPSFRLRMMELGFVRGTEVCVVKYAPLSDPVEFVVKGYHVSLRKSDAEEILMSAPERAA